MLGRHALTRGQMLGIMEGEAETDSRGFWFVPTFLFHYNFYIQLIYCSDLPLGNNRKAKISRK